MMRTIASHWESAREFRKFVVREATAKKVTDLFSVFRNGCLRVVRPHSKTYILPTSSIRSFHPQ